MQDQMSNEGVKNKDNVGERAREDREITRNAMLVGRLDQITTHLESHEAQGEDSDSNGNHNEALLVGLGGHHLLSLELLELLLELLLALDGLIRQVIDLSLLIANLSLLVGRLLLKLLD